MALLINTAEGGTNGGVASAANSGGGSGTALYSTSAGITYSSAAAAAGTLGYAIPAAASGTPANLVLAAGASGANVSARVYVRLTGPPSATSSVISILTPAGAEALSVRVSAAGALTLNDSTGAVVGSLGTASTNTWYRITLWGNVAAAATVNARIYAGHGGTPLASVTAAAANTGTAAVVALRVGKSPDSVVLPAYHVDELGLDIGGTAEIAAASSTTSSTHTANAGPDLVVEPGEMVHLVTRGYRTDTATYVKTGQWSQVSGTPVTITQSVTTDGVTVATFEAPRAQTGLSLVFRLTITDPGGLTITDDVTVTVPPWQSWTWNGSALVANGT
jgi:hypothetical protein